MRGSYFTAKNIDRISTYKNKRCILGVFRPSCNAFFIVFIAHPWDLTQHSYRPIVKIPHFVKRLKYELPSGTQPGEVFRFRGRGIQQLSGRGKGDQYVKIVVEVPKNLNQRQKDLLKEFDKTLVNKPKNNIDDGTTVGEEKRSFFDRFK